MIKPLTSLRFLFAFMVFLSHLQFYRGEEILFRTLYRDYFSEGYLGVSFFFILSGFILSYTYKKKIETAVTGSKEFWLARFARIYPLHLFSFLLCLPLVVSASSVPSVSQTLSNLFLVQAFIPRMDYFFSFNSPSWSISCEMFFYFLFPFLISAAKKPTIFYSLAAVLLLAVVIGVWLSPPELERPLFYIHPFARVADFILGILLYKFFESGFLKNMFSTYLRASVTELAVVGVFAVFFLFHNQIPKGFRYSSYYWLPMLFIIFSFAHAGGIISQLLSNRLFVLLGEISFSMYMLHKLIIQYFLEINTSLQLLQDSFAISSVLFAATIVISYLSYKLIEVPANRMIRQRWRPVTN